jgi:hypothetical protein
MIEKTSTGASLEAYAPPMTFLLEALGWYFKKK